MSVNRETVTLKKTSVNVDSFTSNQAQLDETVVSNMVMAFNRDDEK